MKDKQTKQHSRERGYTLLEYCAGAAIIAGILWTALNALGGNLSDLLGAVGDWAQRRATGIAN
jgi:Flp pilus assembly pilin Flp